MTNENISIQHLRKFLFLSDKINQVLLADNSLYCTPDVHEAQVCFLVRFRHLGNSLHTDGQFFLLNCTTQHIQLFPDNLLVLQEAHS